MRERAVIFICAALVAGALLDARFQPARQASVRRLPDPAERALDGFVDAACVDVSADIRVCKAQRAIGELYEVMLFASGQPVLKWQSGIPVFGAVFDVRLADLDADGRDELLITDHVSSSNGLVVTYHRAIVVSRYDTEQRSFISFELQEFCSKCAHGTYVPRDRRVSIVVTEWMRGISSLDPTRQPGNYIVGRWFDYDQGRLRPRSGVVARRLLNSFGEKERYQGKPDTPASWFSGVHARPLARDPAMGTGRVIRSRRGTIDSHGVTPHGDSYVVRLEGTTLARFGVGSIPTLPEFEGWESLDGIGLVSSGVVLPRGVSPTLVIGEVGARPVRIDDYSDGGRIRRVMWISE